MEVKTILILLVLNIALPTLDTLTDINLVIKLYRGAQYCYYDGGPDYKKCEEDPVGYCSSDENNLNVCRFSCDGFYHMKNHGDYWDDYYKCRKDPVGYCSNAENNQDVCVAVSKYYPCQWAPRDSDDYKKCRDDPSSYCANDENNQTFCRFSTPHYKMATAMLIPFLLNYIVCFITFLRKEKNKKFTFIFALLNLYPQFGMRTIIKRNHWNNHFQYFRGCQDHQPPG